MKNKFALLKTAISKYIFLILLLLCMLLIHQYIFLYADDFYYCRDASLPLNSLPQLALKQLNMNGRVWVHILLMFLLKNNIYIFRIINPIVITLTSLLIVKISINSNKTNENFLAATFFVFIFFLFLHIDIANTTIYYAACSLNYLYPMTIAFLFAYKLYNEYNSIKDNYKTKLGIVLLAFLGGSSTQQAGMISIGFLVLITIYFNTFKKKKITPSIFSYYFAALSGYVLVIYGSIKRMSFEINTGKNINITKSAIELIKTNIFSTPVLSFTLIVCLCCLFGLNKFNKNTNKIINKILTYTLCIGSISYVYIVVYEKDYLKNSLFKNQISLIEIGFIGFTSIYLISILYVSIIILLTKQYPLPLFCYINAVGAQVMLLVVDSRFASSYKIIFPSLLLMNIFVVYFFVKFYDNNIFLLLAMMAFSLNFGNILMILATFIILVLFITCQIFFSNSKTIKTNILLISSILAAIFFSINYKGYKMASIAQNYNLNAIKKYNQSKDKAVLNLKKSQYSPYGYNTLIWNNVPDFVRQCYKINKKTTIKYIEHINN